MRDVLKLNEISPVVNEVFGDKFQLVKESNAPEAVMLRSFSMHEYDLPSSVLCVARAGAGVNNIPVPQYTEKGVVVFNTPGANANAVKELVLFGLLASGRKIVAGIEWANSLKGNGDEIGKMVEKGKKEFVGQELLGKTIGIIGLGAIGAMVANTCVDLGMKVIGYDPYISIDAAWNLNNHVVKETDLNRLYSASDFITMHIPYTKDNKGMINEETIAKMKDGISILNFARGELVDNAAMLAALKSGKVNRYVTDFPCEEVLGQEGVVAIPHLGASTPEAEDNCAKMAAAELKDFLENGNIKNSVNFGNCAMPMSGVQRITLIHKNTQGMFNTFTEGFTKRNINISCMISQSRGEYAYTILDIDTKLNADDVKSLSEVEGVVRVRAL